MTGYIVRINSKHSIAIDCHGEYWLGPRCGSTPNRDEAFVYSADELCSHFAIAALCNPADTVIIPVRR